MSGGRGGRKQTEAGLTGVVDPLMKVNWSEIPGTETSVCRSRDHDRPVLAATADVLSAAHPLTQ